MKTLYKKSLWAITLLALIGFDQFTKQMAVKHLKEQADYTVLPNIFSFSYHENTGAAFSSFLGKQGFLITFTCLVIGLLSWKFLTTNSKRRMIPLKASLLLVISGGVGNLIDRFFHGYVVDFLYFIPINFPKFNLADSYVTVGMICLIILCFFYYSDEELDFLFRIKKRES